jgi:type II secretory pathway predicted ATPase ExeA/phage tail protein X
MYQTYYGLNESPFRLTTDTKFVYWSQTHQSAFRHLLYSVQSHKSLIVLGGEVGTGKTTLLHVLMERVKATAPTTRIAYVVHSTITATELFRYIFHELALDFTAPSKVDYVLALQRFSRQCAGKGERLLLILDEAQNYSHEVLEEIRLLSNIETPQDKLLQIILAGQAQLLSNIKQQELYQLKQRVNVTYNLLPLDLEETHAYIQKRLEVAGAQPDQALFHEDAIDAIYQYAQGIPRIINVICDHALLYSFAANKKQVSEKIVQEVTTDMDLPQGQRGRPASTDAASYRAEVTAGAAYQADRIVIGYTTRPGKGIAPTSASAGTFASYTDWKDWENTKQHRRRKSLLQLGGIVGFIMLILVGIFFVKLPFSQEEGSMLQSSTVKTSDSRLEKSQMPLQNVLEKDVVKPGKEQPYNTNNDNMNVAAKTTSRNTLNVEEKKPKKEEGGQYIVVKKGDTLEKILLKAYGRYDQSRISLVLDANPEISNVNAIFVGQLIRLPEPLSR